jgi:glycosyltransferase involved in cell wall biosynthesis
MKVLLVHNHYCLPGGEDEVFQRERQLLRSAGHEVLEYTRHNDEFVESGFLRQAKVGLQSVWASGSADALRSLLDNAKPDVVHFHNTFPLISPAAYYLCHERDIPAVQSLHNPRLICPAATYHRDGRSCEDCAGRAVPWPGVVHACYHQSHIQTAIVAGMLTAHRVLKTWQRQVDAYIVFTECFRQRFIAAGLPAGKIFLKPHFLTADPGMQQSSGTYALFLGRITPEKGVPTLLNAWKTLPHIPLRIHGEGPMKDEVLSFAEANPSVRLSRRLSRTECSEAIKGARFVVWPSEGYNETFGLVAIEAFACGVPVIASRIGAMMEIVEDGRTGLHFIPGDAQDLAAKVEWAWTHPREMEAMGNFARAEYQAKYTAEQNYPLLLQIYKQAQGARAA